jgi:hypothetical protein
MSRRLIDALCAQLRTRVVPLTLETAPAATPLIAHLVTGAAPARRLRFVIRRRVANARFRRSFEFEAFVRCVLLVDIRALIIDGAAVAKHFSALAALFHLHLRTVDGEIKLAAIGGNVECLAVGPHDGIGLVFPSAVLTVPR